MASWEYRANTGNGAYQIYLNVWESGSSNTGNGSTTLSWTFGYIKVGSSGGYASYTDNVPWRVEIAGQAWSGNGSISFGANDAIGTRRQVASGTKNVGHDSDGTKSTSLGQAYATASGTSLDYARIAPRTVTLTARRRNASAPRFDSVTATGATTASVVFRTSTDTGLGTGTVRYDINYSTRSNFSTYSTVENVAAGTRTVTGLTPSTTYYFRVAIRGRNGTWVHSTSRSITTPAGQPNLTTLTINSPTSLHLTWTAPSFGSANPVTGYRVQLSTASNFSTLVYNQVISAVTAHTVSDLAAGVRYYARVAAISNLGQSGWSNVRDVRLDQVPPAPTLLSVSPVVLGTAAQVTWGAPSPYEGSPIERFEVQRGSTIIDVGLTLSTQVDGLTPGTTYAWRVRAVSSFGTSAWSNSLTVTQPTLSVTPGAYYDGDTADSDEAEYAWEGTPGLSVSVASARSVSHWGNDGIGELYSTQVYRRSGQYAAVLNLNQEGTAGSVSAGPGSSANSATSYAEVEPLADSTASMWVRPTRAIRGALKIVYVNSSRQTIVREVVGVNQALPANTWTRLVVTGQSPSNAAYAYVRLVDGGDQGDALWQPWPADTAVYMDEAMLTLGGGLYAYFDGSTADTVEYVYSWMGTPNASASHREATGVVITPPDPLLDPDCDPFPSPPRPPSIDDSCITSVDRWRRTVVRVRDDEVANWAPSLPTYIIRTTAEVRQMRIIVFANPDQLDPRELNEMNVAAERIISYLPANTTLTIDVAMQRAYASVNGGPTIPADHLLYGPDGGPATWEEMDCGVEHVVAIDVDAALPLGAVQPVEVWLTRMVR